MTKLFVLFFITLSLSSQAKDDAATKVAHFRKVIWEDIDGQKKSLSSLVGQKALVVLSYTECKTLCPTITSTMKSLFDKLQKKEISPIVIFISINPSGDSVEDRKKHFEKFSLTAPNWHFLKAPLKKTQEVAKSLNFAFGEKRNNEHIMHTSQLAIVNQSGKVIKTLDLLTEESENVLSEVSSELTLK